MIDACDTWITPHLFLAATLRVQSFPIAAFFSALLLPIIFKGARGSLAQVLGQLVDLLLEFLASYLQIFNSHGLAERAQIITRLLRSFLLSNWEYHRNFFPGKESNQRRNAYARRRLRWRSASMRNTGATLCEYRCISLRRFTNERNRLYRKIGMELHRKIIFNGSPWTLIVLDGNELCILERWA